MSDSEFPSAYGMSLRDYFAVHASKEDIQPYLNKVPLVDTVNTRSDGINMIVKQIPDNANAIARYAFADAMLKVRK